MNANASAFRHRHLRQLQQICVVCSRQASTDRYQYAADIFPCCSPQCVEVVADHIRHALHSFTTEVETLAALTHMEKTAIIDTRVMLYEALVKIGVAGAFENCTAEQIDSLIEAVWNGLRASMQMQSAKGEIPI